MKAARNAASFGPPPSVAEAVRDADESGRFWAHVKGELHGQLSRGLLNVAAGSGLGLGSLVLLVVRWPMLAEDLRGLLVVLTIGTLGHALIDARRLLDVHRELYRTTYLEADTQRAIHDQRIALARRRS